MREKATYEYGAQTMKCNVSERIDSFDKNTTANINIYDKISTILLENCVPANVKGFIYLRDSIYFAFQDINIINGTMHELYLMVAKRYGASVCNVDRSIRHAIDVAWNRSKLKYLCEELYIDVDYSVCKPSNSEFITLIAHNLLELYSADNIR